MRSAFCWTKGRKYLVSIVRPRRIRLPTTTGTGRVIFPTPSRLLVSQRRSNPTGCSTLVPCKPPIAGITRCARTGSQFARNRLSFQSLRRIGKTLGPFCLCQFECRERASFALRTGGGSSRGSLPAFQFVRILESGGGGHGPGFS